MDTAALQPLPPRETASQACARSLRESILSGRLRGGERLPPERELAATFGVNRLTLRSALAQLEAARLVSVRHGSGYRVRDFREQGGPELLPAFALATARGPERRRVIADLLLARRHLARAVLERLVENVRHDRGLVPRLETAVERFAAGAAAARTAQQRMDADLAFIGALVDGTGSTVFRLMLNPVVAVLSALPDLVAAGYDGDLSANVEAARALVAALAAGTPDLVPMAIAGLQTLDEAALARLRPHRRRSR